MAPSSFTPNERLLRKRLAARIRQRRCRERKRELIMSGIVLPRSGVIENNKLDSSVSVEGTASGDNSTVYSSAKSTPASSPSKVDPVYVNIQNMRGPPQGYGWTYPIMPPIPRSRPPPPNYHHHPQVPSHPNGYYVPSSHHQQNYHHAPIAPVMYPPHHQYGTHPQPPPPPPHSYMPQQQRAVSHCPPYPLAPYGPPPQIPPPPTMHQSIAVEQMKQPYLSAVESDPGDVSRTVSRSPSDASLNSGNVNQKFKPKNETDASDESNNTIASLNATSISTDETVDKTVANKKKQKVSHKLKSQQKALMSTEKAAVAAMLAMKSSSDESDGDSISTGTNKTLSDGHQATAAQQHQQPLSLIASV
jgi:hypothetical protein